MIISLIFVRYMSSFSVGDRHAKFSAFCRNCKILHIRPMVYDRYMCSICSDFKDAEKNGMATEDMETHYEQHLALDRIQRTAFKTEKDSAMKSPGLLLCVFDFSTSQEAPATRARIGNWVVMFTGSNGVENV